MATATMDASAGMISALDQPEVSLLEKLQTHKREVVDCLIASRASYEPDMEGVADILERRYDSVDTSKYELLYQQQQQQQQEQEQQVFVIVRSSNGYVMVAFRGTATLQDCVADTRMSTVKIPFAAGRAHAGFVDRVQSLPIELFKRLPRNGEKLIFTGHSLGAGVASLTALKVLDDLELERSAADDADGRSARITREQILCITFAPAPFANEELASYIDGKYKDRFYHLVSRHDLVPRAHNMFPLLLFPMAQKLVGSIRESWEVKFASALVEQATGMAFHKAMAKLEEKMQALSPATGFFNFVRNCAAQDHESLFYGMSGNLVLFNPDAKDRQSAIEVGSMERLHEGFCFEDKSLTEVFLEHGLANYYDCLLHSLGAHADAHKNSDSHYIHGVYDLIRGLSLKQILADPKTAILVHFQKVYLKLVGNEFR